MKRKRDREGKRDGGSWRETERRRATGRGREMERFTFVLMNTAFLPFFFSLFRYI